MLLVYSGMIVIGDLIAVFARDFGWCLVSQILAGVGF